MNTSEFRTLALSVTLALVFSGSALAADPNPKNAIETIVVTASPLTQDPNDIATIVGNVDRDQILQQGGEQLADSLADVPGVTGTSFAAGASRPVIRGFNADRVRVLENGVGSFDVSDVGPDHGVPIDPLSTQRIEVVRGAATLRYGSQAIGGVVNAINNRVPLSLPDTPITADVTGGYGTNADSRDASAMLDARAGQFAIHADGFDRHTDDYDIPDGTQSNSWFRGDGYSLGSSYFFGDSRVGVGAVHYDSKYGIPGEDTFIDMKQDRYMTSSSIAIGAGTLRTVTVDGGYADYQHSERDPSGVAASTFKNNEWDVRTEALLGVIGPFTSSAVGVQYQDKDFSALGEGADYLLPTTTRTYAAFMFSEAPLSDKTRLQAGARVERADIDGTPLSGVGTSLDFTPISASAGLVVDATSAVRLGFTLSSTARAPAQTELFARGPHDGPATYETGDPTLNEERADSLEATVRVQLDQARFEGALWGTHFNDYIYGELTGRTCDDAGVCLVGGPGDLKELNYVQTDANYVGAEGKATLPLLAKSGGMLNAELLADYVRARLDPGGNVPRIPPYRIGAGLHWESEVLDAGVFGKYSGRQDDVATAETDTDGFFNLDAHLGWRVLRASPGLELLLVGHNLTDSTQRNAVALNKDEVILPGRDVRLVIRGTF